jgi:hypothetical protein
MKPLGREKVRFPNKIDRHPGKKFVNWWEIIAQPSKKRARQNAQKEINQEIVNKEEW